MKKYFIKKGLMLAMVVGVFAMNAAKAQDIHFSQFYETSVLRNPGLVGIIAEDYKVAAVYKSQWGSIGNSFKTFAVSGEFKTQVGHSRDYVSLGLYAYTDKAGAVGLKTSGIYPAINYNKALDDNHGSYLSLGFTGGYIQRSFDVSKATFNNQFQNGIRVPELDAGEELPNNTLGHFDLGSGVSFNSGFGQDDRYTYFVGLAAFHFTRPARSFYKNKFENHLETRWNLNLGLNVTLDDFWSVQLHGNLMKQGKYTETIGGALLRWSKQDNMGKKYFSLNAGCLYRLNDALIPTIRIDYKNTSIGVSYDINTSSLKAATSMRGGMEITAFINGALGGGSKTNLCPRF